MIRGLITAFITIAALWALAAGSALAAELSAAEREYLQAHPVARLAVHPDWPPFEWLDESGKLQGISSDLLRRISERTGLRFEFVHGRNWEESVQMMREGKADLLSMINRTPERDKWLLYTAVLLDDTNIFTTRESHPFITEPALLRSESIALPRGTSFPEAFRRDYPNLQIIFAETDLDALQMVSDGRADITMRSFLSTTYHIRRHNLYNLKIAGIKPEYANHLRIGVRTDAPLLRDILDRGIASITESERREILSMHNHVVETAVTDYRLLLRVAAIFVLILAAGFYWNYRLKRYNRELLRISQTDKLTGLYNRTKIDEVFLRETERAFRYERPFSILMLDADHFKRVNDELGHLAGDRVLVQIADCISMTLRGTDYVGRWGGEEFLILCPETSLPDAVIVAERIGQAIREADYPAGRLQTASIGVAQFHAGDSADTLLKRADEAMFRAKAEGRNRVCMDQTPPPAPAASLAPLEPAELVAAPESNASQGSPDSEQSSGKL